MTYSVTSNHKNQLEHLSNKIKEKLHDDLINVHGSNASFNNDYRKKTLLMLQ